MWSSQAPAIELGVSSSPLGLGVISSAPEKAPRLTHAAQGAAVVIRLAQLDRDGSTGLVFEDDMQLK